VGYLYIAGAFGTIGVDIERGITVAPPRDYKGIVTRSVNIKGAQAYVLDTPANLEALGLEPTRMTGKPLKKTRGRKKAAAEPSEAQ
jgi:hypothetical protein